MKSSKFRKKYKALILDVDGTLILNQEDGVPSDKVKEAIIKANKFLHVGVATSRSYPLISHIAKALRLSGPSIVSAGSRIIDMDSQKILWEQPIDSKIASNICKTLQKHKLYFFIHENEESVKFSKRYTPKKPLTFYVPSVNPQEVDDLIKEIHAIPKISAHKLPSWQKGQFTLSITHAYATKQHAILELANLLNIKTHEIIGVGEGGNDFPLLMACGLKVAMGNAVDDLKAIADYIAPSVEEDGVADVINKFIL